MPNAGSHHIYLFYRTIVFLPQQKSSYLPDICEEQKKKQLDKCFLPDEVLQELSAGTPPLDGL